jgi:hypothetical protein
MGSTMSMEMVQRVGRSTRAYHMVFTICKFIVYYPFSSPHPRYTITTFHNN